MTKKNNNYLAVVIRWCVSASLFFFASGVLALGLGELQVSSNLGEPLKASVPLIELDKIDPQDVKVRLADSEQYKKNGLSFPVALRLKFKIVSSGVAQPIVKISSIYPIDEPFLTLLVEVSSPIGVLYKTYTFLLDPAPGLLASSVEGEATSVLESAAKVATQPLSSAVKSAQSEPKITQPTKKKARRISPSAHSASRAVSEPERSYSGSQPSPSAKLFGKLSLTLSTSLSISKNDPSASSVMGGIPMSDDALQEELIAKEKSLHELNAQIGEMQVVIKSLQTRLGQTNNASAIPMTMSLAASDVVSSAVLMPAIASEPSQPPAVVTPPPQPVMESPSYLEKLRVLWTQSGTKIVGAALLLLAAMAGYYWYRRRQREQEWSHGPFDVIEEDIAQPVAEEVSPAVLKTPGKVGEQSMKMPAFKEQKTMKTPAFKEQERTENAPPSTPPEYDFLEEADIYLRFGHDKLAEEVLREAIKINPNNPHSYLTLLGIFESRGDPQGFAETAKELKAIGDTTDWHKAMQMGKKLDPTNPLYEK